MRHSYDSFGNLKGTKTKAGRRELPLTGSLADAFREHRAARESHGIAVADDTPVILTDRGTRVLPDVLGRWWSEDREALDAGGYCLHELRHSFLSMLAYAGVHPSVMQGMAGHASAQISMDVYTHINMESKQAAAEALESVLEG